MKGKGTRPRSHVSGLGQASLSTSPSAPPGSSWSKETCSRGSSEEPGNPSMAFCIESETEAQRGNPLPLLSPLCLHSSFYRSSNTIPSCSLPRGSYLTIPSAHNISPVLIYRGSQLAVLFRGGPSVTLSWPPAFLSPRPLGYLS